jgi:hypothetical protein
MDPRAYVRKIPLPGSPDAPPVQFQLVTLFVVTGCIAALLGILKSAVFWNLLAVLGATVEGPLGAASGYLSLVLVVGGLMAGLTLVIEGVGR